MYEDFHLRIARSLYGFHELKRKLGVQKLFDVFNLELPILVWRNLDDQSRFVDERYADSRICIVGGLEGTLGGNRKSKGAATDMDKHFPGYLGHRMNVDLRGRSEIRLSIGVHTSTNLEILQNVLDFLIVLDPLFFGLLRDLQGTRECVMDVVGMEGCGDLVDVTVDKPLGPRHDGLGLRA